MLVCKYHLQFFRIIGLNFMTSLLKSDFSPKSLTSEKKMFDPNLEFKFQISQFLGKCFEYNFKKNSIFDIYGAKIFLKNGSKMGVKFQNILF
jgi:hypothetical protein